MSDDEKLRPLWNALYAAEAAYRARFQEETEVLGAKRDEARAAIARALLARAPAPDLPCRFDALEAAQTGKWRCPVCDQVADGVKTCSRTAQVAQPAEDVQAMREAAALLVEQYADHWPPAAVAAMVRTLPIPQDKL